MSVGRICVREVDTAQPDESVSVAAQRMQQRAVGTLVVVNGAYQVVGIVTDRDLVSRVLAKGLNPLETAVRAVMTMAPKSVFEETPIETALLTMRTGRFRRLPVIDRTNTLLGLLTLDDVLMLLAEEFAQIGRLLKRETPQAVVQNNNTSGVSRLQNEERIHAQEDRQAAEKKAADVVAKLHEMKLDGRQDRGRGCCRNAQLHGVPARALDADPHQQSAGTADA
jgi:CBS domain-containing protein